MLLDYASFINQEPQPTQKAGWVPRRKKTVPQQVVRLSIDAELPAIDAHAFGRVRTRAMTDQTLLMVAIFAILEELWSDELFLAVGAALLLEDDADDEQ